MKNIQSVLKYLLPVFFILLLVLPFINNQMGIWKYEREGENRQFKDSLSVDINKLDDFPKEAESYFNDNFSFRTPLLELYHKMKFSYFKISPHPDKTIVGSDGWFFMAAKEKEIYGGNKDFSKAELDHFLSEWKNRKKYLDSMSIKAYWIIAPMKHYVYGESLPFNIYSSKKRRVNQLEKYLKSDFPNLIIDPLPLLLANKNNRKLFYKLDNHWNYHSGYLTTKKLLERIQADFPNSNIPEIRKYNWQNTVIQSGIHYKVIGVKDLSEIKQIPSIKNGMSIEDQKYGFKSIEGFPYPREYEVRYTNKQIKSGLKILFIRDSFSKQLIPFVREVFEESVFIFDAWRYQLNKPIIEVVKPDIVVYLGLETHLENMLKKY
ncbi:MAG: hypothetical protein P8Q42_11600 [Flavobacteriales bacterium]|nr:hypothetical protein [Flavobacteriales bacterium]